MTKVPLVAASLPFVTVAPPAHTAGMQRQLKLIEPNEGAPPEWQLDEPTKELGRQGVAAVRAALQQARRDALRGDRRHNAA